MPTILDKNETMHIAISIVGLLSFLIFMVFIVGGVCALLGGAACGIWLTALIEEINHHNHMRFKR